MDENEDVQALQDCLQQTAVPEDVIENSLRIGDLYTQYIGFQFLVMLSDVSEETTEVIAGRIHEEFNTKMNASQQKVMLHHSFPLRPAE